MRLVEVDMVGAKAAQAGFASADDVLAAQAFVVGAIAHRAATLGRQDDPISRLTFTQPASDDLFSRATLIWIAAERVGICRVEEVDARFVGNVHDSERGRFVSLITERHRSQA